MLRWLKLTIAYDGTDFAGWQVQPEQRTVQLVLQQTLEKVTGESLSCVASGRTDSGVHARGQVVGVKTQTRLSNAALRKALNAELPADVAVLEIEDAAEGFHPIRDAVRKGYRYQLHDGRPREVFQRRFVWQWFKPLDVEAMHAAAQSLVGRHDFRCFESVGAERESTVRTIFRLDVSRGAGEGGGFVFVDIEADGFLYNMARAIVGTLVEIGRGAQDAAWLQQVLAGQDRKLAGMTAPPQGLFLMRVEYEGKNT